MRLIILLSLIFALIISLFAVQNAAPVEVRFLTWSYAGVSLALVVMGAFASGALLTWLLNSLKKLRLMIKLKDLQNKNRLLEEDNQSLRNEITKLKSAVPQATEKESG